MHKEVIYSSHTLVGEINSRDNGNWSLSTPWTNKSSHPGSNIKQVHCRRHGAPLGVPEAALSPSGPREGVPKFPGHLRLKLCQSLEIKIKWSLVLKSMLQSLPSRSDPGLRASSHLFLITDLTLAAPERNTWGDWPNEMGIPKSSTQLWTIASISRTCVLVFSVVRDATANVSLQIVAFPCPLCSRSHGGLGDLPLSYTVLWPFMSGCFCPSVPRFWGAHQAYEAGMSRIEVF